MDADLTLATVLAKARLKETVHQEQQEVRLEAGVNSVISAAETEVDFIAKKPSSAQGVATPRQGSGQRCLFCGQASHPRSACPAKSVKCHHSIVEGHFSVVCHKKAVIPKKVRLSSLQTYNRVHILGSVCNDFAKARFIQVSHNGTPVFAKVGTGAEVSVVSSTFSGIPARL
ncbi:unnamed protein product [Ixodes persulcatus]